jgi:hypothetical protein
MEESPEEIKVLDINFIEEAGRRWVSEDEFTDWYEAIQTVLAEAGIFLEKEIIQELGENAQEEDEFELSLIIHMLRHGLIKKEQMGPEWEGVLEIATTAVEMEASAMERPDELFDGLTKAAEKNLPVL